MSVHSIGEKLMDWKIQMGAGLGSAGIAGPQGAQALQSSGAGLYEWVSLVVASVGALVALASLVFRIWTYLEEKKLKKSDQLDLPIKMKSGGGDQPPKGGKGP